MHHDPARRGEITRVVEIARSFNPTPSMLPDSSADAIARHHGWLKPDFWDDTTGDMGSRIQSYVVKTPRHTVRHRHRRGQRQGAPRVPALEHAQGHYLDDLRAAGRDPRAGGLRPLHASPRGSRRAGTRAWSTASGCRPSRSAKYVMVGSECEFWKREQQAGARTSGCFTDSVAPIMEAGKAVLVDETFKVDEHLRFEPSHGHTPGHSCVRLTTRRARRCSRATSCTAWCRWRSPSGRAASAPTPRMPRARARRSWSRFADSGVLICAAHFPRPGFIVHEGRRPPLHARRRRPEPDGACRSTASASSSWAGPSPAPSPAGILARMGADVIKVERPEGDDARGWGPPFWNGVSPAYLAMNSDKRGITLDLKDPTDVAWLMDDVGRSDVLVHNMRPGVMEELGLGPDVMLAKNPAPRLRGDLGAGPHRPAQAQPRLRAHGAGLLRPHGHERRRGQPAHAHRHLAPRLRHRHVGGHGRAGRHHPARPHRPRLRGGRLAPGDRAGLAHRALRVLPDLGRGAGAPPDRLEPPHPVRGVRDQERRDHHRRRQ